MVEGFRRCADHLEKFGGHEYAGGLSIKEEKLGLFAEAFERVARDCLADEDLRPCLDVDAQFGQRTCCAEYVGYIAERVFMGGQVRIRRHIDTPAHDVLAFMIARSQSQ